MSLLFLFNLTLVQRANPEHPYGYSNMPYVSSLISGAMIFCLGSGVSIYHGIAGLMSPPDVSITSTTVQ